MRRFIDSLVKCGALALACLSMVLLVLTASVGVLADSPSVPNQFFGSVTINGSPAGQGVNIVAVVNGVNGTSTSTDSQGRYGYSPVYMVEGSPGASVTFLINGVQAGQTATFASGGIINLNLTAGSTGSTSGTTTTTTGYTYNILSNSGTLQFSSGMMQSAQSLASTDGRVVLSLASGTSINMQGQYEIAAANESSPQAATDGSTSLSAYSFQPAGATFSPAATLTLKYDNVPSGADAGTLYIAYWTGSTWQELTSTVNTSTSTVSAPVSHFTVFSLRCPQATSTSTTSSSSSSSTASSNTSSSTSSSTTSATTSTSTSSSNTGAISTSILGTASSFNLSNGNLTSAISLGSNNGKIYFSLAANTAVNMQGSTQLSIAQLSSPPVAPAASSRIIASYSCTPDNATFNPSGTITIKYDTADIPTGVSESSLQIALLDGSNWIPLSSSVVNTTAKTVTAQISHFSTYALIGAAPAQSTSTADQASSASGISYSDLTVDPQTVNAGSPVAVTLRVVNGGSSTVSKNIALNVNGVDEAQKTVDLVPGKSQVVTFNLTKSNAGTYNIKVGHLSSSFQVKGNAASSSKESIGIPWLLISGIVGGVIVVAIVIRILVMKSKGDL